MLLSFDPNIYCNPWAKIFEKMYIPQKYQKDKRDTNSKRAKDRLSNSDDQPEVIESIFSSREKRHVDITSKYENWIKIGFALCTTLGEQGRSYYHRIWSMYPRYTPEETDRTYTQLLTKNYGRPKPGTIIYLAREEGVKISFKKDY